ncbi:MAG: hypothetical protein KAT43_05285 [Nanoarchaeota archaeon]|nr:hypothetical protein [Nanoarchaeota archaeon]
MRNTQAIIRYTGLKNLTSSEKRTAEKLASQYHAKIQEALDRTTTLKFHFKVHDEEGKKKKYSVTVETVAANRQPFSASRADWDLARTMHRALKYLEREIKKKLRTDDKGIGTKRARTRIRK